MPTTYAIPNGRTVMAATLYTGNGSTQNVSNAVNGVSFQPDLVWVKDRTAANQNVLFDSIRGATKYLVSNTTGAEGTVSGVTSFNSNGFGVGSDASTGTNNDNYVGWQWQAGAGSSSSNTNGSITSTVSVNATAGFSVVTWTNPTTSNFTVGHGLGVAPSMIITKVRSSTSGWVTYHVSLGNTYALTLNTTNAQDNSANYFNSTSPTSTVFTLGNVGVYGSSATMVAYCWAPVAGFSKFGSYTGNGSADGPFVYCGFRPRFVMIKRTDSTGNWILEDTSRSTYNVTAAALYPNLSNAEDTSYPIDILSNGFKIRSTDSSDNASGGTFIYAAFAENPFKYANAR